MPEYRHGPYSIAGAKLVTCEICGHQHRSTHCVFCEKTGDNGNWIEEVLKKQAQDPRHNQSAFKDKKKDGKKSN
jgi:hypothetical protein